MHDQFQTTDLTFNNTETTPEYLNAPVNTQTRPFQVRNGVIEPLYSIEPPDGQSATYVVNLISDQGEITREAHLNSAILSHRRQFCIWLLNQGPFSWSGTPAQLRWLREALQQALASRVVRPIFHFGCHEESQLWFSDDSAITPRGQFLLPDSRRIIQWAGVRYQVSETDKERQEFALGRPRWRPSFGLVKDPNTGKYSGKYSLCENTPDDPEALRSLFGEFAFHLKASMGGWDAYAAIGSILAFCAAPEFFAQHRWFPDLWVSGKPGTGKPTLVRFLRHLLGFDMNWANCLTGATLVGVRIVAQQFSWLPLWFEVGLPTIERQKLALVHSFYDRGLSLKEELSKVRREILSNAILTCETPPEDPDTQRRFVHVHLTKNRWPSLHLDWFKENSEFFFVIGRALLRRRSEYVRAFQSAFERWCTSQRMKNAPRHSRLVNGVAYAGFVAAAELLQSAAASEVEVFGFAFGKEERPPAVILPQRRDALKLGHRRRDRLALHVRPGESKSKANRGVAQ